MTFVALGAIISSLMASMLCSNDRPFLSFMMFLLFMATTGRFITDVEEDD